MSLKSKGVILAGGTGSRLMPLTKLTNKHLLPVYNKPMIYYPINTFVQTGIKEILIVTGTDHAGDFLKLLGSGREFGVKFTFELQDSAAGIADALRLAEDFIDGDRFAAILGDNIFEDSIRQQFESFLTGKKMAQIFLKKVPDAQRFGVAELKGKEVVSIEEKPKNPKTDFAVTGLYMYSGDVFDKIRKLTPSKRGEYEITDVNNAYIRDGQLSAEVLSGFWSDAGTFESLYHAAQLVRQKEGGK